MVIPHTFLPSRGDRVRWHAETNYGHSTPCHPGSIVTEGTQRQIMVILRLVSTKLLSSTSSGDHMFVGMRPTFDHFEVLGTHH